MLILQILAVVVAALLFALALSALFSRLVAGKVAKVMTPRGQFTDVRGGRIHWQVFGEGPPLVMVHGLSANAHHFTYSVAERLAADYRVIVIDRPGCGHSTRAGVNEARLPEQARMIAEFLEAEGIDQPLIVGHSLGGAVSLALALDHADRIRGAALLAPLVAVQTEAPPVFEGLNIASPMMRRFVAETLAVPMSIRDGAKIVSAVFAPDQPPEDFRTRGGGLLSLRPDAFFAASTDLHAVPVDLPGQVTRYGAIDLPLGILYGEADAVLDARTHTDFLRAAQPELDVEFIAGAGHMLPVSHPDETEAFVRRMAERVFSRA